MNLNIILNFPNVPKTNFHDILLYAFVKLSFRKTPSYFICFTSPKTLKEPHKKKCYAMVRMQFGQGE